MEVLHSIITAIGRWVALPAIVASTLWLRLQNIAHFSLCYPDESCHAIVARNLLRHPFKPTLVEFPWIAPDNPLSNWMASHIWLHKPILPLWQIALSYAAFGVNAFALRFPSALLATGAVVLTFLIGRALFDRTTGLVAAALQSVNVVTQRLVLGGIFSDHVDVSLIFWAELGIFFGVRLIQTGRMRYAVLTGIAFGLAYLSKYFLGLVVPAVLGVVFLLGAAGVFPQGASRLRFRHMVVVLGAGLATAGPWVLWCFLEFKEQFLHEHVYALQHLGKTLEGYGAPWDRLVFDYLGVIHGNLYVPLLVGAVMAGFTSLRRNRVGLAVVLGWLAIVLLPHLLAASKTPTATVVAIPAACLLVGALVAAATRLDAVAAIAVIAGTMAGSVFSEQLGVPEGWTLGWHSATGPSSSGRFGGVLFDFPWLAPQLAWAAGGAGLALLAAALRWSGARIPPLLSKVCCVLLALLALFGAADVYRRGWQDSRLLAANDDAPDALFPLGLWASASLPPNAALMFEGLENGVVLRASFWADRSCYAVEQASVEAFTRRLKESGAEPFLVTKRDIPDLELRYSESTEGWKVYGPPGR